MSAKKYQIFISSTFEDLKDERAAVINTILRLGHFPVGMEIFNAGDDTQWTVIQRTIDSSDYYVVIVGLRYGSTMGSGKSYTEHEYEYAVGKHIPVLAFIKNENIASKPDQRESDAGKLLKLNEFREKVKKKMVSFWEDTGTLTTALSASLNDAFLSVPRTGWIPASFDPAEMGQEVAILSKENRALRKQLEKFDARKPDLEFCLESDDDLHFKYVYPYVLERRVLSPEDISQELVDKLEELENIEVPGLDVNAEAFEYIDELLRQETGDKSDEAIISEKNITNSRKYILDQIEKYNADLPSQRDYDEYNEKLKQYVDKTKNTHRSRIRIDNSGTSMANLMLVTLHFPPELLVFDNYNIGKVEAPKILKIPRNPLRLLFNDTLYTEQISNLHSITPRSVILGRRNDYNTNGQNVLVHEKERLIHTKSGTSDDFYIVATQSGIFEIRGELICEEIPEPLQKVFTVIVE